MISESKQDSLIKNAVGFEFARNQCMVLNFVNLAFYQSMSDKQIRYVLPSTYVEDMVVHGSKRLKTAPH